MRSTVFILIVALAASALAEPAIETSGGREELEQLLPEYNQKYEAFASAKGLWSIQLQTKRDQIAELTDGYESQKAVVEQATMIVSDFKLNLVTQEAYLEFLRQTEPKALEHILKAQQAVVARGEFSHIDQVTEESLSQKNSELESEVQSLRGQIEIRAQVIRDIESRDEYQQMVEAVNFAVDNYRIKDQELSSEESALSRARSGLSGARDEHQFSVEREENARNRADNITRIQVPSLERDLDLMSRDLDELIGRRNRARDDFVEAKKARERAQSRLAERKNELSHVQDRRDRVQSRLQKLRADKKAAETPEEKARIQAKIDEAKSRLDTIKQEVKETEQKVVKARGNAEDKRLLARRSRLRLERARSEVGEQRREIEATDREIARLELEANSELDRAASERSLQVQLEQEISSWEREISNRGSNIANLEVELSELQRDIDSARGVVASYRQVHIAPIETEIAGLNSQIEGLKKRQGFIAATRLAILRERKNIDISKTKLAEHSAKVEGWKLQLDGLEKELVEQTELVVSKKATANDAIRSYNQFQRQIETTVNEFNNIEKQILTLLDRFKEESAGGK